MNPQLSLVLLVAASLLVCSSLAAKSLNCESRTGLGRVANEVESETGDGEEAKPSCWNEKTAQEIALFPIRGTVQSEQVLRECVDREGSQKLVANYLLRRSPTCSSAVSQAQTFIEKNARAEYEADLLTLLAACKFCQ